jgi:hypothetical protein
MDLYTSGTAEEARMSNNDLADELIRKLKEAKKKRRKK